MVLSDLRSKGCVRGGLSRAGRPQVSCLAALGPASFARQAVGATAACSLRSHLPSWRPVHGRGGDRQQALCFSRPGAVFQAAETATSVPGPRPRPLAGVGRGGARGELTLRQAYSRPKPRVQYAFKDSMIHGILQFTLRIAFRCVLHRCGSQDIRC